MHVEVVNKANDALGYLGGVCVRGPRVWAVGGKWSVPTILRSNDGGLSFRKTKYAPATSGLRDVWLDDDAVWVVGENGVIARSTDDGMTWETVKELTQWSKRLNNARICLYAIDRDAKGVLWVTGDDGILLRSKTGKRWAHVPTATDGRLLALCRDPRDAKRTWLVDSDGAIQRWTGKKFAKIDAKAMRVKRPLTQLARTPAGSLIVIGDLGLILRSTSDGASWKKIPHVPLVDYERLVQTRFGMFVVGNDGTLLVSYDDGRRFETIATGMTGHLWTVAEIATGLLVTAERGAIWRIPTSELALQMKRVHPIALIRDLAARVADGEDGAMLVLEDALKERELW